jgi:hypothetical protein
MAGVSEASVEPAELDAVQRGDHDEEEDDEADADHGALRDCDAALPAPPAARKPACRTPKAGL